MLAVRRREFLSVLGGAAIGIPRTSFAQISSSKIFHLGTLSTAGPINEKSAFGVLLFICGPCWLCQGHLNSCCRRRIPFAGTTHA
jgi:hypothetical protein